MDKPRFSVIENGETKPAPVPKTADEKWQDECAEDAIRVLREQLKAAKESTNGRVVGVTIAIAYADGAVGDVHSKCDHFPHMVGAIELAKFNRMSQSQRDIVDAPEPKDDDE